MKKTIIILVGPPCSGKSTWAKKNELDDDYIVSRNKIRINCFGIKYKHTYQNEEFVTQIYNDDLETFLSLSGSFCSRVILDDTHIRERYIDEIIKKYGNEYNIMIKFFDEAPLWKLHVRNVIRYFYTGQWIPLRVINNMFDLCKQINRMKYVKYIM